ncbi:hypothetical protein QYE76_039704 [Lolium multiflorum]|uniref:Transposase-associated domain-containing protein n=2 Tax=Lolium multiflorum TaxID=4521 RepID=A0AAD8WU86_LOLMU|nr:hypothetical protein QYE76_039704 [Lolium multiflorum]
MGKPRDTKIAILPSTTRKGTTLSTSAALDSPSVISKLVSPPQASNAGTSAESDDASAVLDNDGSLGSFLDATIARSRQIENTETPNENAATPVNSPESVEYSSDDLDEDYVELDDDFIEKCNATTDARKIKKLLAEHAVRYKLSPDPKFATSPINIMDKDYDFSLDLSHIAIVEKTPFCGTEKESAVEHMIEKRTPDDAEELLAKIGRNHDDWSTPEPTPTPILKKRGMIKLNDEDMREAKKSLKEKGIKPEDVKNLPPIEDLCKITPPSSMIEDPLYPEGHPKRVEQDSQLTKTSAPSKKKKKKHKNVVESSEPVNDPNSISISDAETESGNEHDKDNDKDDTPDKEEVEEEPEKHAKNKKYTKEDFIAEKHGNEREPWVQKQMPFPAKKLKSKEEEHYNKFCDWMKPLFLQIPLTDAIKLPPYSKYMKDIVSNKRKIPNEEISTMLANYSFSGKVPKKLGDPGIPTIPCSIKNNYVRTALCDLGAGVSVMPFSLYKRLDLDKLIPTDISLQMADKSTAIPVGVCENVPVQVTQHCLILTDFVVLEMPEDDNMSIILGRPFLNTAGAVIDCNKGKVTFNVDDKEHTVYFPKRIDKATMVRMMSEGVVARFLKAATAEMIRNNQKEIRCPCRRCKLTSLMDPKADMVRDHLLVRGFMDGYRWEGDEDDYEFVHGISTRNKEGGEHHVEVPGHDQDVEDPGHDHDHNVGDHGPDDMEDQDGGPDDEDHEDEDDGPSSMDWVQDPYLQELLLKQTSNARDAAREKAKMDQLEVDAVTPLYEGCRPEDTRLKVTLMALQMKVKHKMTDTSFNDNMSFWHERLPKGNDINLYMGLLKEELATLWDAPANTWDAAAEEYFPMRAALLTTVHDFLGYGYVAGQVVHGFNACVRCMDDTTYRQLDRDPGSSKTVFMGHRRWLRDEDPWRKRKDLFDGQDEPRRRPRTRSGEQIDELLKNWKECPPPGKKRKAPEPLLKVWKTRSVFWDLPYWKILRVPHSLDVMHITKNVCESLLGTLLNMPERTKDGPKARYDLLSIGIREELHAGRPNDDDDDDDDNDDDEAEDTQSRRKGKKAKKIEYYCPPRASL